MSTYKARQKALRSSTHKFLATSALTAVGLATMGIQAAHAQNVAADALPQGAEVTRGSASYDYSQPNTLTIEQHAALTSAEYKGGFNIGRNAAVIMLQEGGDIFVHIDKSDNTSYIEGFFSGSGSNYVLNKNGVMITGTARIDMNSFVASTAASLDLDKLEDGQAVFTDFGDGAIVIEEGARVTVAEAGLAAFVSPFVSNAGVINAKMGTVAIGAGETVTLDLYGDGLVELAVDGELEDALVENTGTIAAEGGKVQISARAAKQAVDNIINVDGIVTASSASVQGGKIVLSGGDKGTVNVGGKVEAKGTTGGDIEVTGQHVVADNGAEIDASGTNGGGTIHFGGGFQGQGDTPTSDTAYVADSAILRSNADEEGDGGEVVVWSDESTEFYGNIEAKGGAISGDGGLVEVSGRSLVYAGAADTRAYNGNTGWLLLDPLGIRVYDGPAGVIVGASDPVLSISDEDLNVSLGLSNVLLATSPSQATYANNGGAGLFGEVTVGNANDDNIVVEDGTSINTGSNTLYFSTSTLDLYSTITGNVSGGIGSPFTPVGITLKNPTTVNVYTGATTQGSIQQGIDIANSGGTVNVGDGTYVENVVIDKSLNLLSMNGRDFTTIEGVSGVGALGTVKFASNTSGVKLGDHGKGFTIVGIDNGNPAIENAAVYLQGTQDHHEIKGNDIVANGDSGLTSEYGANVSVVVIDGNIFSGQTFVGPNPAGDGFGNQFSLNNVPRQLVVMGGGTGGGNTSSIQFSNNTITGTAGGLNGSGDPQGNTLVTIDADSSEITGNTFMGTTTRFGASLRARGDGTLISGNTFHASGLTDTNDHIFVANNVYTGIVGQDDILDIWNSNTFVGRATVSSDDVNVNTDRIGLTIQGAVDDSNAGANIYVNAATYNENVDIDKSLTLNGARAGENAIGRTGDESVIEGYIRLAGFLDGVTIDGFTIVNQGENVPAFGGQASIAVNTGSQNIEILNNKFDGNGEAASFGVVTSIGGVENVHIQHNDFTDLNGGIYVNPNAVNVDIQQNRFRDNNVGAVVEDGDGDTKVRGNRFINNNEGVVLFGDVDAFRNNRFRGDPQQHIAYLSAAAADLLVDESTGNRFWSDGEYKFTDDMSNDELFALEDQVFHKMDDANNGLVVFRDGELFVTQNSGSIQRGVDASDAGGILWVGDGTFNENVNVWKALTINGDGTVATTIIDGTGLDGHGITVAADNVSLNGMIIENFNGPYYFASGIGVETDVNNLSMNDIVSRNNKFAGLYVSNLASVNGLIVSDSHFDNNVFGWYFQKDDNSLANISTVTNVDVDGTSFDGNSRKGLYLEKLDNASFTTIQVLNSGTDVGSPFENAGVDINLKNGNYENIAFDGLTVSGSGVNTAGGKRGSGVIIKARNDGGTYSLTPASLTNVTITNANIDAAGDVGLAFGNNINGGSVTNSTISGPEAVAIYGGASNLTIGGGNTIDADGEGLSSIGLNFGIGISGGSGNIVDDNVITADGIGVAVQDSVGSRVRNNDIDAAQKGVYADNAQDIQVNDNIITGAAEVGVHVKNSDGTGYGGGQNDVDIWSNVITNAAGATGVLIENSKYATVGWHPTNPFANANTGGNTITGGENGVVVRGSNNAYIAHNDISGQNGGDGPASGDGIYVNGGNGVQIRSNAISDVEDDGIQADESDNITVADNELEDIGKVGIAVIRNSDNQTITGNTVMNSGYTGIRSSGAGTLNISGNTVNGAGHAAPADANQNVRNDAIHVDRLLGGGFASGSVSGNTISNAAHAGIEIENIDTGLTVSGNTVSDAQVGIYNNGSDNTVIDSNTVSNVGTGILVNPSLGVDVLGNIIHSVTNDAIKILNSDGALVSGNFIGYSDAGVTVAGVNNIGGDGVFVDNSDNVEIKGNKITETHSTGADKGSGIQVINTANAVIGGSGANGNTITNSGWDGIRLQNNSNITVENNSIDTTERVGIWGGWVNTALIKDNVVKNDGLGGYGSIHADFGSDWTVTGNDVDGGDFGIRLNGTGGTNLIDYNKVDDVTADGISTVNTAGLTIDNNDVGLNGGNVGGDGIEVAGSTGAQITNNNVNDADGNGIYNNGSNGSAISGNTIMNVGLNGVLVNPSMGVTVSGNTIDHTGGNGVSILSSDNSFVTGNFIGTNGGPDNIGDNGVYVSDSADVEVTGNWIRYTKDHGVEADLASNQDILIGWNWIRNAGWDGVNVDGGYRIDIRNNWIEDIQWDGIDVANSDSPNIYYNTIRDIGLEGEAQGIEVYNSAWADVNDNYIDGTSGDAIYVGSSNYSNIYNNEINDNVWGKSSGGDGIEVAGSYDVDVYDNRVDDTDKNGIYINGSNSAWVAGNTITDAGQHGILVNPSDDVDIVDNTISDVNWDGIHIENGEGAYVYNNDISDTGDDGIDIWNNDGTAVVDSNEIFNTGGNGIEVDHSWNIQITNNAIDETDSHGIYVNNSFSADIEGNEINDNVASWANTLGNGIYVIDSNYADVKNNHVEDATGHGIYVSNSDNAEINDNTVQDVDGHGIFVNPSWFVDIAGNTIQDVGNDGIHVDNGGFVEIWDNEISETGDDGIHVDSNFAADIWSNDISETGQSTGHGDGIYVEDSNYADVNYNNITQAGRDGINIWSSDNVDVIGNDIFGEDVLAFGVGAAGAARDGIHVENSDNVDITDNSITGGDAGFLALGGIGAGRDGIHVVNSFNADILRNTIMGGVNGFFALGGAGAGRDGIYVDGSAFADIRRNRISEVGDDGIDVDDSFGVDIVRNRVSSAGDDGIYVDDSDFADIRRNRISDVGDDGIDVDDSFGVDITRNRVSDADDNGIEVSDSAFADIRRNRVTRVGDSGIDVDNSFGVDITRNRISFAGDNGIEVDDSDFADIRRNRIAFVADNGIDVDDSFAVDIQRNLVAFTGNDGIHVEDSNFADIEQNLVTFAGDDGIDVEDSWLTEIRDNGVFFAAGNGIEFQSGGLSVIDDNTIAFVGGNGIYVNPSYFMAITNNTIDFTGDDGIDINDGAFFLIANNEIGANGGFIGDDGIDVDGTSNVMIENNIIQNAAEAGIELTDTDLVNILFNSISDNGDYGLWVRGADNLSVVLSGNTFTDNPTGARFESGAIDLRGAANSFINTNPLGTPIGMQFDEAGTPGSLTIVGNTLGSTIFDGFGNLGSYYVRIEDGTLLDTVTGDPIVINGLNASFDGLVPASFGGILTLAQLNFIENRLHDADDAVVNGRGQIFVGSTLSLDVEEFFNQFGFFGPGVSGFNLTFLGLPPVTLPTGNLNNIQTFAGPGDLNNISPAAGEEDDAESLADIEPAAGGEETSCWTDIWNAPVNGGVNFNYSGDPTESLNAAASCGS